MRTTWQMLAVRSLLAALAAMSIALPAEAITPVEIQKLIASDGTHHDYFGSNVAIDGDTAVIGASGDEERAGCAYVFVRIGGNWVFQQKLTPSERESWDMFGEAVAVDGDTAMIGAPGDGEQDNYGAVYVFTRAGTVWTQQAKLTIVDPVTYDNFGAAVVIAGNMALIGAPGDDSGKGAVYLFTRTGSDWALQATLTATPRTNSFFGQTIAMSGDTVIIGANYHYYMYGAAYVFTWDGAAWTQQQMLMAADGHYYDWFGMSVAIDGDTAVIGASVDDATATDSGSAYVFTRSGTTWTQQAKLTSSDCGSGHCGTSVAVAGDTALVGAQWGGTESGGGVYVFTRSDGIWTQQGKLSASGLEDGDHFGVRIALNGGTAMVGAIGDDGTENLDYDKGAVYVFGVTTPTDSVPPEVTAVTVADIVYPADAIVTATATDAGSNIKSAAYSLEGGAWTPMLATDGAFDEKSEGLTATIEGLTAGEYGVCVRATDTADNTSDGSDCDDFVVAAADLTITFGGVYIDMDSVPTTTLKVTLSGPDACKIGATVEFYEKVGTTWNKLGEDVTNEVGYADLSPALALGVHEIKVVVPDQYLDDGETPECTGDDDTGMTVVADANAASSGGGWYKVEEVAPPRVNFGYVANVKFDKKTTQWVTSGNFLWINQNNFRLKGKIDQSASIACPSGDYVKCAAFAGGGTLYEHNDAYDPTVDDPSLEWTGNSPLEVSFVATVYDGGSSTVCQKKRCTVTERPDAIMMQINGASIPAAPYEAITLQGGGITVKK